LHGDFWPGNVLWHEDAIAAVIDWEDAAVGDPLSDLAGSRVELACAYGEDGAESFTTHYERARGIAVDRGSLALWEVLACSAALSSLDQWGLEPHVAAARRTATRTFLTQAATRVRAARPRS